jgi:hypothetical protein
MAKIWFDFEFIEDGKTIDPISIGMIRDDGKTYYAEFSDCDLSRCDDWLRKNVVPKLERTVKVMKPKNAIKQEIIDFVGPDPEFWAYYAAYDWVALCQLYGRMMDLPEGWPMLCRDVKVFQLDKGHIEMPGQDPETEHHALHDAIWTRQAYQSILISLITYR